MSKVRGVNFNSSSVSCWFDQRCMKNMVHSDFHVFFEVVISMPVYKAYRNFRSHLVSAGAWPAKMLFWDLYSHSLVCNAIVCMSVHNGTFLCIIGHICASHNRSFAKLLIPLLCFNGGEKGGEYFSSPTNELFSEHFHCILKQRSFLVYVVYISCSSNLINAKDLPTAPYNFTYLASSGKCKKKIFYHKNMVFQLCCVEAYFWCRNEFYF